MAAQVEAKGGSFQVGAVQPLFTAFPENSAVPFAVTPDGKRFVIVSLPQDQSAPLTLLVNWQAAIRQ